MLLVGLPPKALGLLIDHIESLRVSRIDQKNKKTKHHKEVPLSLFLSGEQSRADLIGGRRAPLNATRVLLALFKHAFLYSRHDPSF